MSESSRGASHEADSSLAQSPANSRDPSVQPNNNYEEGRITVSVRVRPLNAREMKLNAGSCITPLAAYNTLYILPPGGSEQDVNALLAVDPHLRGTRHHRFTFDYVYPVDSTQEQVYEQIGRPVLQSSFRGYHTCIFAYGQTGSGKSYSMMGADGGCSIDNAPGIIPRLCREMFLEMDKVKQAALANEENVDFSVYVSYLEIYRERVRSLLNEVHDASIVTGGNVEYGSPPPRATSGSLRRQGLLHAADSADAALRVREHPTLGVYVEGLTEISVTSEEQVLRLMVRGNQRRHVASTRMNETSSRSHAIFTLQLLQNRTHAVPPGEGGEGGSGSAITGAPVTTVATMTKQLGAKINLVDLAGSERVKATGADGDTLKEGAQINKSLTTLGIVINALAAQSTATTRSSAGQSPMKSAAASKRHIPYRDSTLTFLLKESLGGNSKTFMIATVSPSADSYDESLSTLRYADRAKSIVMKAFVNETAGDKRIRELEEEVVRLREQIRSLLSAETRRSSTPMATPAARPVVLADSDSSHQSFFVRGGDGNAAEDNWIDQDKSDSRETSMAHSSGAGREVAIVLDGEAELAAPPAGLNDHASRGVEVSEPASPVADSPVTSRAEFVATLKSELHRAEEMIRQLSASVEERNAHTIQLVRRHEEEQAVMRAMVAAVATKDPENSTPGAVTATMRLCRDEPYLLNMDGAGDWVVAHLGPGETLVGVFPPNGDAANDTGAATSATKDNKGDEIDSPSTSFDSSLVLPSYHAGSDADANEAAPDEGAEVRYVRLPREFSEGVGGPHCTLERFKATDSAATPSSTTTLRAYAGYETYVIRPMNRSPFVVKDGDTLLLQSGDVLDIGAHHIQLKYMDPAEPPVTARERRTVRIETTTCVGEDGQSVDWAESDRGMGLAAAAPASAGSKEEEALMPLRRFIGSSDAHLDAEGAHEEARETPGASGDGDGREGGGMNTTSSFDRESLHSVFDNENSTSAAAEYNEEDIGGRRNSREAGIGPTMATPQSPFRPFIPTLDLGKALPVNRQSMLPPQQMPQRHDSASGVPFDTTSANAENSASSVLLSDSEVHSTANPSVSEGIKAPSLSIPLQRRPTPAAVAGVKTRMPSKRAPQTAHLNSHSALFPSELQWMRLKVASKSYHSEPPPRFVGRYNLVLVGASGSGKSSLVRNLQTGDTTWLQSALSTLMTAGRTYTGADAHGNTLASAETHPTIGINTTILTVAGATPMRLHVYELSGTPCFSPLLDQLPSRRVTYLLCFPLDGGPSLVALRGIIEDILCRTDSHTVSLVLVATHAHYSTAAHGKDSSGSLFSRRLPAVRQEMLQAQMEEVEMQVVSLVQMLQPYAQLRPTVVGRFAVDNVHRQVYSIGYRAVEGFPEWLQWLGDLARDRCRGDVDFANGLVPARCMELSCQVGLLRELGKWCLPLRDFKALATAVSTQYDTAEAASASLAKDTLRQHVQLLADWGVLAHRFRSTPLCRHVVLDVAWLCRVLTTLACCALVGEAELGGVRTADSATIVAAAGKRGAALRNRKDPALRILFTPDVTRIVDVMKVASIDTVHLLRYGVLPMPVLVTMLEPHFKPCDSKGAAAAGSGGLEAGTSAVRRTDNLAVADFDQATSNVRYSVPLAGVLELLVLCDAIILGHKLLLSPSAEEAVRASTTSPQDLVGCPPSLPVSAASQQQGGCAHDDDDRSPDDINPAEEGFVVYPLSCRTPASAGVTLLFPCFLSGPFYLFKLDMVPRNFFPKLMCRLATVSDKIYLGPVQSQSWSSPTQWWATDAARVRGVVGGKTPATHGPFDSYFSECAGRSFVLPRFSTYWTETAAEVSPRRRDGLWFDAAWLVYKDSEHDDDCEGDNCRVLVRLVHHSVFLSFHCHQACSSLGTSGGGASPGVQDFYEAVLEVVRHVVEEFPGSRCSESMQCCVDPVILLEMEMKHPALQSDQEAAALHRHVRFASINDNLNSLERVLAKSGWALQTARTSRRSHTSRSEDGEDESAYVPLLRNFSATCPLDVAECIRRWRTEQHFDMSTELEARLMGALQELGTCYHGPAPVAFNSCFALDRLLDVLTHIDTV
ncbi:putative Unc104-like kinesin [Leishmania mexicana MHOM/GT/2001/U1103]|uniref:Unc104-like kinesin n=1 Tax=Leishmania mexicana (strain MHOM/GT/2001/U1103) TaxID=929439 RepID=E9B495_LEIMU|nr:putative Unc104-like kinesin [Leishmania mexicana MHOM/GT/2001/U1103]CBZ30063.1 putative Unc104-like kinesin [Leishmania mexicana MHOM/GT/2001/U1103]